VAGSRASSVLSTSFSDYKKWAYKLTGEYAVGKEFVFYDSVYSVGGVYGPAKSSYRDIMLILISGIFVVSLCLLQHFKNDLYLSAGGSNSSFVQVTTSGRNQMRGLTYNFIQARC
jgi:iron complex outermembrane receptor protein